MRKHIETVVSVAEANQLEKEKLMRRHYQYYVRVVRNDQAVSISAFHSEGSALKYFDMVMHDDFYRDTRVTLTHHGKTLKEVFIEDCNERHH